MASSLRLASLQCFAEVPTSSAVGRQGCLEKPPSRHSRASEEAGGQVKVQHGSQEDDVEQQQGEVQARQAVGAQPDCSAAIGLGRRWGWGLQTNTRTPEL